MRLRQRHGTRAVPMAANSVDSLDDCSSAEVEVALAPDSEVEPNGAVSETKSAATLSNNLNAEDVEDESRARDGRLWTRVLVFGALPAMVMIAAVAAGFAKYQAYNATETARAETESVQAASQATVEMLSYNPDTVEQDLAKARDDLTGTFRDSYEQLTNDVVIPGAKKDRISAVATVPAAASVSASPRHAVVIVFVNQTTVAGDSPPTNTASSVRISLDRIDGNWLISDFTPI